MMSQLLQQNQLVRADLAAQTAWSLHPPDHGPQFIAALPQLISKVESGWFPGAQAGNYDLQLDLWM